VFVNPKQLVLKEKSECFQAFSGSKGVSHDLPDEKKKFLGKRCIASAYRRDSLS
jgi:hypothetical protein